MSIFGKMRLRGKDLQLAPEVMALLEEAFIRVYRLSPDKADNETLRFYYDHLEVLMFFEILCHLPGKHLEAFVQMNEDKRSRADIDAFLEENMPHADEVFVGAIDKFREYYRRIGGC